MLSTLLYLAFLKLPSKDSYHSWLLLPSGLLSVGTFLQQSNTFLKATIKKSFFEWKFASYPLTLLMKTTLFHSVLSTCQCWVSELENGLRSECFLLWLRSRAKPVSLWMMWTNIVELSGCDFRKHRNACKAGFMRWRRQHMHEVYRKQIKSFG